MPESHGAPTGAAPRLSRHGRRRAEQLPRASSFITPVPLFDHVRIDGIDDGKICSTCSRDLDVFTERFEAKSLSFGVLPTLVAGDRIRVRLYLLRYVQGDVIPPEIAVDVTASLPPLPTEG